MLALTVSLAVLVGVSLGLLGGGGSILTVPLLAYVAGLDAKQAIATSLLVVGVTSAVAAVTHATAGRVRWRVAVAFGLAAMAGAYTGGLLAPFIPATALLIAFAAVMVAAGSAMLRGRKDTANAAGDLRLPLVKVVLVGIVVGLISGLVGAGGGFLLVPALALLARLPMPTAVGTSLVVISMQSFAGFAGHLTAGQLNWRLAGLVTAAAVIGALIGGRLVVLVDATTMRALFGWFVLLMASIMLAQEVHPAVGATTGGLTLAAAAMSVACTRYAHCPLRRLTYRRLTPRAAG
jgi:uncharacterized protein